MVSDKAKKIPKISIIFFFIFNKLKFKKIDFTKNHGKARQSTARRDKIALLSNTFR
jgi:hypothetical protein